MLRDDDVASGGLRERPGLRTLPPLVRAPPEPRPSCPAPPLPAAPLDLSRGIALSSVTRIPHICPPEKALRPPPAAKAHRCSRSSGGAACCGTTTWPRGFRERHGLRNLPPLVRAPPEPHLSCPVPLPGLASLMMTDAPRRPAKRRHGAPPYRGLFLAAPPLWCLDYYLGARVSSRGRVSGCAASASEGYWYWYWYWCSPVLNRCRFSIGAFLGWETLFSP